MKNSFAARVFIVKDGLGYGLKQKANKVFSYGWLYTFYEIRENVYEIQKTKSVQ